MSEMTQEEIEGQTLDLDSGSSEIFFSSFPTK